MILSRCCLAEALKQQVAKLLQDGAITQDVANSLLGSVTNPGKATPALPAPTRSPMTPTSDAGEPSKPVDGKRKRQPATPSEDADQQELDDLLEKAKGAKMDALLKNPSLVFNKSLQ